MPQPYIILLLAIAFINLALAVYSLRFIRSQGALAYTFIMVCLSVYSFGYALELQAKALDQILFWLRIEYIGISLLPSLFIIMAAQYTGRAHFLRPWLIVPLFLVSFSTLLLEFTNYGNIFYKELKLNTSAPFILADFVKGPWYWVHQVFANLMLLLSSLMYFRMFQRAAGEGRIRALIMLLALDIPWCFYILYLAGGSPYNIDLSPFSFSIAGILTAFGIFRYSLLEYVPLALENVFSSMTVGVVILDDKRRLVNYNPPASQILPQLGMDMKGKSIDQLLNSLPCQISFSDNYGTDIEIPCQGEDRYYHLQVVAVNTKHQRPVGWTVILSDITERKLKEMDLLHIEKKLKELNTSKDKFFAIIAHDLRNAFHLMINMSEMAMANIEQQDNTAAFRKSRVIYETSVNTYALLQNLLDWALMQLKGVPFNPINIRLADLVRIEIRNLKTQAEHKELSVTCPIDDSLMISGDEEMLKTVLRNLISNAIKYSHHGGKICINVSLHNSMVHVEVSDEGIGISPEEQEKLFRLESYFTRKGTAMENGTGLGLKLCKEFIGKHGGDIWAVSRAGAGSTFAFSVPVAR